MVCWSLESRNGQHMECYHSRQQDIEGMWAVMPSSYIPAVVTTQSTGIVEQGNMAELAVLCVNPLACLSCIMLEWREGSCPCYL